METSREIPNIGVLRKRSTEPYVSGYASPGGPSTVALGCAERRKATFANVVWVTSG